MAVELNGLSRTRSSYKHTKMTVESLKLNLAGIQGLSSQAVRAVLHYLLPNLAL